MKFIVIDPADIVEDGHYDKEDAVGEAQGLADGTPGSRFLVVGVFDEVTSEVEVKVKDVSKEEEPK